MAKRAVLFDVDGTLVDTNQLHAAAWQQAFRDFGCELPIDEIHAQIGKGGDNLIPTLLPERLVARAEEIQDHRSELFQRDYLPRAVPFAGVRALFETLYGEGVTIVLASSAKRTELEHHLELIGCAELVQASTSRDDVERSKPCPDIFEAALAKVPGLAKEQAVVVGDSPWDLKAAAKADVRAVAVRSGGFDESWLSEAGADAIFDGPEDLCTRRAEWLPPA